MEKQIVLTEKEFEVYEKALKAVEDNLKESGLCICTWFNGCYGATINVQTTDETMIQLHNVINRQQQAFNALPDRIKKKIHW